MRIRACLFLTILGCTPPAAEPVPGPRVGPYQGWKEALFLEAPEARVALTGIPAAGGRIISYSLDRENILFENPDYLGKTLETAPADQLKQGYIGYNVDLGPELRRLPEHLRLWMGPYAWSAEANGIHLSSENDAAVSIRIDKDLRLDRVTGDLHLLQTMTNLGGAAQAYCLWDRTLCKGGGFALVRLSPRSRFKAGWSLLQDGVYSGDAPAHPRVRILEGVLVAEARGNSAKLGVDTEAGWVAYARGRQLFIKYFPQFPGTYSDGGNRVEVYFDPRVCELEPLSPEWSLKPGESYSFPERWRLMSLAEEITTAEQARALVDRIPPSPFR